MALLTQILHTKQVNALHTYKVLRILYMFKKDIALAGRYIQSTRAVIDYLENNSIALDE